MRLEVRKRDDHIASNFLHPEEIIKEGLLLDLIVNISRVNRNWFFSFKIQNFSFRNLEFWSEHFESLLSVLFEELIRES